jgi:DNA-binding transcriptional LysR family regulator
VAILPEPTLERELQNHTLAAVPFYGAGLVRPLGIVYRHGRRLPSNTRAFVELLQNRVVDHPS